MPADLVTLLATRVRHATSDAFGPDYADVDSMIRRSERADFQADLAFGLARRLRQAPPAIAQRIAGGLPADDVIANVEAAGGYLNITLQSTWLDQAAMRALASNRLESRAGAVSVSPSTVNWVRRCSDWE